MVGFFYGDPTGSATAEAEAEAAGSNAIPATFGQGLQAEAGLEFSSSITPRLYRAAGDALAAPSPTLQPDEANQKYSIPGVLTFKNPVSETTADDLHRAAYSNVLRQDAVARSGSNVGLATHLLAGAAGGLGGFAVGGPFGAVGGGIAGLVSGAAIADPLNIATALIPGLPEARVAGALGDFAMGAAGRATVRAISGATAGAAGQAALEPLNYALDQHEQQDWSMGQALRNMAFGAAMGGGLHTLFGAIHDVHGNALPDWASPAGRATEAQVEAAGPQARQDAAQTGLAQILEDRPVEVAPVFEANAIDRGNGLLGIAADTSFRPSLGGDEVQSLSPFAEDGSPGYHIIDTTNSTHMHFGKDPANIVAVYRDEAGKTQASINFRLKVDEDGNAIFGKRIEDSATNGLSGLTTFVNPEFRRKGIASGLYDFLDREGYNIYEVSGRGDLTPNGAAFTNSLRERAIAKLAENAAHVDPEITATQRAADAAVKASSQPNPELDRAAQQIADHEQFFQQAREAGVLDASHEAEIQTASEQQQRSGGIMKALMQAAACLGRVGG